MIKSIAFMLFLSLYLPQQTEEIKWQENRKLSWEDFQQTPDKNSPYAAMSRTGLHFKYSSTLKNNRVELDYTVTSYFDPKKSWHKPEARAKHILNHEQIHFDISELHARKLRKRMSHKSFSNDIKNEVEQIYLHIEGQRKAMQQKFDNETNHSLNIEKQVFWRDFITKELQKYDAWK